MNSMLYAALAALIISIILYPLTIPLLHRLKFGQNIRNDGPKTHLKKAGTPTMGGIVLIPAAICGALIFNAASPAVWTLFLSFLGFGLIGLCDDLLKIAFHRSLGLTVIQKLIAQFLIAFIFLFVIVKGLGGSTDIAIPLTDIVLPLGWFYYVLMSVFFVFMVNAVNLTDGLDGLCGGISAIVFAGFAVICVNIVPDTAIVGVNYDALAIAASALCGACIGFLIFNHYPAKIFMGDTGSLALGGALIAFSALTKTEILLILLGGVYLIEAASVMLQVFSFKVFGRRIFLMSPLHHHFEMKGWREVKVVAVFWLAALILTSLGVIIAVIE